VIIPEYFLELERAVIEEISKGSFNLCKGFIFNKVLYISTIRFVSIPSKYIFTAIARPASLAEPSPIILSKLSILFGSSLAQFQFFILPFLVYRISFRITIAQLPSLLSFLNQLPS